jgi:uncharacterized repeat protein (TIGR01451 family)
VKYQTRPSSPQHRPTTFAVRLLALVLIFAGSLIAGVGGLSPAGAASGGDPDTICGRIFNNQGGSHSVYDSTLGDVGMGGVTVHGAWTDTKGAYQGEITTTSNADGTYCLQFPTDGTFNLDTTIGTHTPSYVRVVVDAPAGYSHDQYPGNGAWMSPIDEINYQLTGVLVNGAIGADFIDNWQFSFYKPTPQPGATVSPAPSSWTNAQNGVVANAVCGSVYWDLAASYELYDPLLGDKGAAGIPLTASWKDASGTVQQTLTTTTRSDGQYCFQFDDPAGIASINTSNMLVDVTLPTGAHFTANPFQGYYQNCFVGMSSACNAGGPAGGIGSVYHLNFGIQTGPYTTTATITPACPNTTVNVSTATTNGIEGNLAAYLVDKSGNRTNLGTFAASSGTSSSTFNLPTLPAGSYSLDVDRSVGDPSTISITPITIDANTYYDCSGTPGVAIAKTATLNDSDGDGLADAGETVSYSFKVTDTGETTLINIGVTDPRLTGAITCADKQLAPGQSTTCTAANPYTVTAADITSGSVANTATTTATNPGGGTVTNTGSATVPVDNLGKVTLTKTAVLHDGDGDGKADAGETITYSFTVNNVGPVAVSSIAVNDPMLTAAGLTVTCPQTSLAGGASMTCTASGPYTITQAQVDGGAVTNTASATGTNPAGVPITPAPGTATVPADSSAGLAMVKSATLADADGDGKADAGETIAYSFLVTNSGAVTASNISVADPKLTAAGISVSCPKTSLAGGASMTCTASPYTVKQADVDAGSVANTATASGQNPNGGSVSGGGSTTTPTDNSNGLSLVKSASLNDKDNDGKADAGETIAYSFLVTNTGAVTASNIVVADPKLTAAGITVSCPKTSLAGGASMTCTATPYTVTQADVDAGSVTNIATATGDGPGGVPVTPGGGGTTTPTDPSSGLSLVKSAALNDKDNDGKADAGETITYSFLVTNTGSVTDANIAVADPKLTAAGITVSCPKTSLAGGASMTCTATPYTVTQADVDAGSVANTATATGDGPGGVPVTPGGGGSTTPTDPSSGLSLVKSAALDDKDNDGKADAGETITYSFLVTNTGAVTASNIAVADPKLTAAGITVSCPKTSLAGGASMTCTAAPYTVTQADVDAGSVANTATATGDGPGGTPETPGGGGTTTPTDPSSGLSLVKSAALDDKDKDGKADAGETITYSFLVTNTGAVTASNIVVADPMLTAAGVSVLCPKTALAGGASMTCTAAPYTVTQADVNAGSVANTATAAGNNPTGNPVPPGGGSATTPTDQRAELEVVKRVSGYTDVNRNGLKDAGDTLTYAFAVTNSGTLPVDAIAVHDALIGAVTCPSGTVAPGATVQCLGAAPYVITQADVDAGAVTNTATASGNGPQGSTGPSVPSTAVTPLNQVNGLNLVKKVSSIDDNNHDQSTNAGDGINYSFTVTNTGTVTATGLAIHDPLLTAAGIKVTCPSTSLAPGASTTCVSQTAYVITKADAAAGSVTNTATADATGPGGPIPPAGNSVTTVVQGPIVVPPSIGTGGGTGIGGTGHLPNTGGPQMLLVPIGLMFIGFGILLIGGRRFRRRPVGMASVA